MLDTNERDRLAAAHPNAKIRAWGRKLNARMGPSRADERPRPVQPALFDA